MKVLQLCLLLIDVSASLKILGEIKVIISTKNYDTNTSPSFSSRTSLWYSKGFCNLITKKSNRGFSNSTKSLGSSEL